MRAVILAGGKGTRLRPYTTVLPKPLVPVGERPILELILNQLHSSGFSRADLCVGHLGGLIRAYLGETGVVPAGLEIHYTWEEEPLGTAGALHLIERPEEPFLVMNGDILTTLDYGDFLKRHSESGAALTIATHQKDVPLALGVIESSDDRVTGYVEKPTLHYDVSMGIYAYSPWALDYVPEERFDFPDLVSKLIDAGEQVNSQSFDGQWFDIGTREEHDRAVSAFDAEPDRYDAD